MDRRRFLPIAGDCAFAVLVVLAGTWFFYDRLETGIGLNFDGQEYVAMVNGTGASDPFRFRVLVPWMASLLPFSPEMSLKLLTCIGLAGCYVTVLKLAERCGVRQSFRWAALFASVMSAGHVYNYSNPFSTDGVGLLFISTVIYSALAGALGAFVLLVVVGTTCREALFLLGGAWLHRSWRTALMVVLLGAITYGVVRAAVGSTGNINLLRVPRLTEGAIAWGVLWIAFPIGLLAIRRSDVMRHLIPALVILCVTAAASSLIATDTARMVAILFPFVAIGTGLFVQRVAQASKVLAWLFLGAVAAKGPVTVGNRLFGPGSIVLTSPAFDLAALLVASTLFCAAIYAMQSNRRRERVPMNGPAAMRPGVG